MGEPFVIYIFTSETFDVKPVCATLLQSYTGPRDGPAMCNAETNPSSIEHLFMDIITVHTKRNVHGDLDDSTIALGHAEIHSLF